MGDLADITILLDAAGMGTIQINGEDVSERVAALSLRAEPHHTPIVAVELHAAHTTFTGPGIVQIVDHPNLTDLIIDFLATVDPVDLEAKALDQAGWGDGPGSTTRALLDELANLARALTS